MKILIAALSLLLTLPAPALTLVFTDTTPSGGYPNFDPDGSKLAALVAACDTVWQDIIEDSGTVNITYRYNSISGLANGTATAVSGGKPTAGHINVDDDETRLWFFDPTPTDNSEYEFTQRLFRDLSATEKSDWFNSTPPDLLEVSYRGLAVASAPADARNGFDMFTTVLHEIGHVIGLSSDMAAQESRDSGDFDFDVPSSLANGNGFGIRAAGNNPDDVNDWAHIAAASFICNSCAATGLRRLPAATDVLAIAACSNWSDIDLPRKDFLPRQGVGTGSSSDYNNASNWIANQVPGAADEATIRLGTLVGGGAGFNVNLSAAASARSLFLSAATDLNTTGQRLDVGTTTTIEFDGNFPFPQIFVSATGELETSDLIINGGELDMAGGLADIQDDLTLSADTLGQKGGISGAGTVAVAGTLRNDGRITGTNESGPTLTFTSAAATPWDLDGTIGNGEVFATVGNVNFASGALSDAFDGIFRVDDPQTLTIAQPWTLSSGGLIDLNGGDPAFATFAGGLITASGGTIDASGLSRISAPVALSGTADLNCLGTALTDRLELDGVTTISGGSVVISADSELQIDGASTISGGTFSVAAGAMLDIRGAASLAGGTFTGAGEMQFDAPVTVNQPVVIGTTDCDMDGVSSGDDTLTLNNDLTVNSTFIDDSNSIFNDTLSINGSTTTLHIPNVSAWTCAGSLNITTGTTLTFPSISGAPFTLSGTATLNGGTRWDTQTTISGTVNFVSSTSRLALTEGDAASPHRLVNATINVPGTLRATGTSHVTGNGTIAANIDFVGSSALLADNGTLQLGGAFTSIGARIGTADADGTLNVTTAWTLPAPSILSLNGGTVTGAAITNASVISGFGTVTSAQIVNNGTISATGGQLLTLNTTASTDLDGTGLADNHTVNAVEGDILISKPLFDSYDGILNISQDREVEFLNTWTLNTAGRLNMAGGTTAAPARLVAPSSTLGGQITCTGECQMQGIVTLTGAAGLSIPGATDFLRLFGNTTVAAGAGITGTGGLIAVAGATLTLPDNIIVQPDVLLAGFFELAGTAGAQATIGDYAPTSLARVRMDLTAPPSQPQLNDRLSSSKAVALAGHLDLRFTSLNLTPGQRWTILDAPSITGTFASITPTGVPAGTALRVVYTPTTVDVILIKSETFVQWQTRHGLTPPHDSLTADPDNDGLFNDLEYTLGLDPQRAETVPPFSGVLIEVGGVKYLSVTARVNTLCAALQASPRVTRSTTLTSFTTTGVVLHSSTLDDATQVRTMTWRSTQPFGLSQREYLRLEAVFTP